MLFDKSTDCCFDSSIRKANGSADLAHCSLKANKNVDAFLESFYSPHKCTKYDQATSFLCTPGGHRLKGVMFKYCLICFNPTLVTFFHSTNPSNTTMAVTTHEATSASGTESETTAHQINSNNNNSSNNKKNSKTRRKKKKAGPAITSTVNGSHVAKDDEEEPKEVHLLQLEEEKKKEEEEEEEEEEFY